MKIDQNFICNMMEERNVVNNDFETLKILAFFVPFFDKIKKKKLSIQKVIKSDFSFDFRILVHKTKLA